MPTHKSCEKRVLTSRKQNLRNRMAKSRMHTAITTVLSARDRASAERALKVAYSVIDKSAKAGVIHRNKAANQKARLARFVKKIAA